MINISVAKILHEMGEILEILDIKWKPEVYYRAAQIIESYPKDLKEIYDKYGLEAIEGISGIGEGIGHKIEEFIKIGKIKEYEKLKKEIPPGLLAILRIPGMGPKKAKKLYQGLGVETLSDLKKACKEDKIKELTGFGAKSQKLLCESLSIKKKDRIEYGLAKQIADDIVKILIKEKLVNKIEIAGSLRRKKETIGDIDILCTAKDNAKTATYFCKMKDVKKVIAKGKTKSSVLLKNNIQVDLRIVKEEEWGSALNYFTGSKEHNILLREIAIKKGLKLSEYGVFDRKTDKLIASKTEEDVYKALGLPYIPPEKRDDDEYVRKFLD